MNFIRKLHLFGHLAIALISIWSVLFAILLATWLNATDHLIRLQWYHYVMFMILVFLTLQVIESAFRAISVRE